MRGLCQILMLAQLQSMANLAFLKLLGSRTPMHPLKEWLIMMKIPIVWTESARQTLPAFLDVFFFFFSLLIYNLYLTLLQHNEEAKIAREVEAHEKRIRKELEKQDLLNRKVFFSYIRKFTCTFHGALLLFFFIFLQREEQMRRETERHDRERRKEEERLMRERQREEERFQKEQRREHKRMEKFMQKQSIRVCLLVSAIYICNTNEYAAHLGV